MNINIRRWSELAEDERRKILSRSEIDIAEAAGTVSDIIMDVRKRGDSALKDLNHRFDGSPKDAAIRIPESDFDDAAGRLTPEIKEALEYSVENVRRYHADQAPDGLVWKEIRPGIMAGERTGPIDSAAFYVPRARGSFPSMLYMMAVPAQIAGVPRLAMASPPDKFGKVDPACLYTAGLCGVGEVYAMGGAQAWAALAYGTESVEKVDKCLGPGSKYVAAAKRLLGDVLDCGLPAGPSESVILADSTPDPRLVAQDLLVEAEHGSDSAALLITDSPELASASAAYLADYAEKLPEPRRTFVSDVLSGYGGIILVDDMSEGVALTNDIATEHLQIRTADPFAVLGRIRHAGEILLGENTPFSAANYSVGANAVLPTGGNARTWSGVSVGDFKKRSSVVYLTRDGLNGLRGHAAVLAEYEGFPAHKRALTDR
ncbi:MAG: histidinol dehydrogenase [Spirochaetaceae bacterium]|nr:histidinol dehydrogenase [Spirochaetaceae bacterium]